MCSLHTQQYEQVPQGPQPWNTLASGGNSHGDALCLQSSQTCAILQLYSTAKAPQHQISQQQSFSSGPIAGKLATFSGAVQNAIVVTLQFRASRDAPWQAQTYTGMRLMLPCGAMSQVQEALHKPLYMHWDGNPSQSPWKASRKQQESATLTSRGCCPRGLLFQASSSTR